MDITRYNKLISTVIGAAVGYVLAWLATKTPLVACVDVVATATAPASKTCTLLGIPQTELTGLLVALFAGIGNLISPKNSVTPTEAVQEVEKLVVPGGPVKGVVLNSTPEGHAINSVTGEAVTISRTAESKK